METRVLGADDEIEILNYAYERERENTFLIGSILRKRFPENTYIGAFEGMEMVGLAVSFGRFGSLIVHGKTEKIIERLVDDIVPHLKKLVAVPDWQLSAAPTIERLKHHGILPTKVNEQTMYLLTKDAFVMPKDNQARMARKEDVDNIIRLARVIDGDDKKEITDADRFKIPTDSFFIRLDDDAVVALAATHGMSKHYAMIGGVGTHPDFRGKGYAKETVGALAYHWLAQGKEVLLFCANDNEPAKKVYKSLGFTPVGEFLEALYSQEFSNPRKPR